ncbi:hypothetical protein [Paenibacillus montanisoli]|uniref:Uncharacterized protein n=1 Tax=Paenibacillus montanisoli TaxID=2081970 RepID=A0A328U0X0_9BACL|nr:hypothetical protein [Paenibacillus montanisoli]RAP75702.1 hypothetical protein DL346_09605 [Paenibacillus montanisoli]
MKGILCSLLIAVCVMTGCSNHSDSVIGSNTRLAEAVKQETEMPLEMPTDFNFMVSFGYGEVTKNVIDTYKGTFTKDLVVKGSATANIEFSTVELRDIYNKMKAIDIMGPKELTMDGGCFTTPSNEDKWKITVNGETKTISWTDKYCAMTEDANQLLELRNFIKNIVESKEAYKALPEAEGGYD